MHSQGFKDRPINQYEALGKLGSGALGTVILAQHVHSKVKVAIKFMLKEQVHRLFTAKNMAFTELELFQETSES